MRQSPAEDGLPSGVRLALAHDSFTQWGGAERVVAFWHRLFPTAPIYTLAVDPTVLPDEMADAEFRPSFLQRLPGMPSLRAYRRYLPLLPVAAASLRPEGFDLVLSSSSSFAHGLDFPGERHVAYIHNTMRFAWDYADYVGGMGWPGPLRALGHAGAAWLRRWDRRAGQYPGRLLANSRAVAERIRRRWGRRAEVLHPPVEVDRIPLSSAERRHFCVVSRLLPYKRLDLAVRAATLAGERLLVVGTGPDLPRLRALAGPTVEFLGAVSEEEKHAVLAEAVALVVPGVEDFGLAPVEANATGTPVVALRAGGVLDSQVEGVTALLVPESSPEAFAAALRQARARSWDRAAIRAQAEQFAPSRFRQRLLAVLRQQLEGPDLAPAGALVATAGEERWA